MQAKKSVLSLAIAGLFVVAGTAVAYGPGPQGGGMGMMGPRAGAPMDPAQHAERVQARLGWLKDALKLQPAQQDAWNAYEAKVKAQSTFASLGATASAPIEALPSASKSDRQVTPASRVLHTPPSAAPK